MLHTSMTQYSPFVLKVPLNTKQTNDDDYCVKVFDCLYCIVALAVAYLTAVREVPGSNLAVGSCVYRTTTVIYSLGHELCTHFLQCLGQLLPSTLCGMVNEYQLLG